MSQQNGAAERKYRHIIDKDLMLLTHSHLPPKFWDCAFEKSIFLINRLPTKSLHFQSPYQFLNGHTPDYNFLSIFGCFCFSYLGSYKQHKLEPRSRPCVFLGYP